MAGGEGKIKENGEEKNSLMRTRRKKDEEGGETKIEREGDKRVDQIKRIE